LDIPIPFISFYGSIPLGGDTLGMIFHHVTIPHPLSHSFCPLFFLFSQPSNIPYPPFFLFPQPSNIPHPPFFLFSQPSNIPPAPPLMHPSPASPTSSSPASPHPLSCISWSHHKDPPIPFPMFPCPLSHISQSPLLLLPLSPLSPLFSSNCPFLSLHHPFLKVISVLCVVVICVMYGSSVLQHSDDIVSICSMKQCSKQRQYSV